MAKMSKLAEKIRAWKLMGWEHPTFKLEIKYWEGRKKEIKHQPLPKSMMAVRCGGMDELNRLISIKTMKYCKDPNGGPEPWVVFTEHCDIGTKELGQFQTLSGAGNISMTDNNLNALADFFQGFDDDAEIDFDISSYKMPDDDVISNVGDPSFDVQKVKNTIRNVNQLKIKVVECFAERENMTEKKRAFIDEHLKGSEDKIIQIENKYNYIMKHKKFDNGNGITAELLAKEIKMERFVVPPWLLVVVQ